MMSFKQTTSSWNRRPGNGRCYLRPGLSKQLPARMKHGAPFLTNKLLLANSSNLGQKVNK